MKSFLHLLLLVLLLFSCSKKEININTESDILNDLLNSTNIQEINLDQYPVDTVYVKRFINFRSPELEQEGIFISDVVSMKSTERYFYIFTRHSPFIIQFDNDGNYLQKVSRQGEGPGEYIDIKNVAKNNDRFYIMDAGNARINVYDHHMNYLSTISPDHIAFAHHNSDMLASDRNIFLKTVDGNQHLIQPVRLDSSLKKGTTFLPRLVPTGKQPKAVNNYRAANDGTSKIALAYLGLPYIIMYDSTFSPVHSVILKSQEFNEDITSLEPKPDDGTGIGVSHIISYLDWRGSENLVFVNPNVMTILTEDQQNYRLTGRFTFAYADPEIAENYYNGVPLRIISSDREYMYLTSSFNSRVYRIPLSKIGL